MPMGVWNRMKKHTRRPGIPPGGTYNREPQTNHLNAILCQRPKNLAGGFLVGACRYTASMKTWQGDSTRRILKGSSPGQTLRASRTRGVLHGTASRNR